ncbi:unnamed protein product [Lactuca virosa]|uniref:Secreted protein n=1 Tax=Lactuca virosa TaxID=75947 RepID=A0AAU9PRQ7_9ASTR|nr:unnamed protein product [Lactuca virosa]
MKHTRCTLLLQLIVVAATDGHRTQLPSTNLVQWETEGEGRQERVFEHQLLDKTPQRKIWSRVCLYLENCKHSDIWYGFILISGCSRPMADRVLEICCLFRFVAGLMKISTLQTSVLNPDNKAYFKSRFRVVSATWSDGCNRR